MIPYFRAVTKISSRRVNTTSRWGIKQLGISFGSIFLPFSHESSRDHVHSSWGNPRPLALDDCSAILDPKSLISLLYPKLSHLKTMPFTQHIPVYLMFGSNPWG